MHGRCMRSTSIIFSPTAILHSLSIPAILGENVLEWKGSTVVETGERYNWLIYRASDRNGTELLACVSSPHGHFELRSLEFRNREVPQDDTPNIRTACVTKRNFDQCADLKFPKSSRYVSESGWSAEKIFFFNRNTPSNDSLTQEIEGVAGFEEIADQGSIADRFVLFFRSLTDLSLDAMVSRGHLFSTRGASVAVPWRKIRVASSHA